MPRRSGGGVREKSSASAAAKTAAPNVAAARRPAPAATRRGRGDETATALTRRGDYRRQVGVIVAWLADAGALSIVTIESEERFAALAADGWDDLVRAMPRPTPFLLHAW